MWTRCNQLLPIGLFIALAIGGAAWAQPPEVAAPAAPEAPDALTEEAIDAIEELEEALEEAEGIEDEIRDEDRRLGVRDRTDRRERVREIRAQVRRRLREASSRSDSKVSFGSSIHIEEDEVGRDLVTIGGNIRVDGDIYGDAVAVGGSIEVNGKVTGDLVAVGGGVELGPEAQVLGEVTSVGGQVEKHEDAEVLGRINEVSVGSSFLSWDVGDWGRWSNWDDGDRRWGRRPGFWGFGLRPWLKIGWKLSFLVMLALLACLVQLIGGDTVERVRLKAIAAPWVAGLVGLAIQLLFVPVLVVVILILFLSIIGIPLLLLLPFVFLALLLAWLVGYTGSAMAVGRWFEARFDRSFDSPFVALLVGVTIVQGLSFVGEVFGLLPGFLWIFALMFGFAGFLVQYAAWTIGLGAVFLNGFRRPRPASGAADPPPPPVPDVALPEAPVEPSAPAEESDSRG